MTPIIEKGKKISVGKMILLSGIITASGANVYAIAGPLERTAEPYQEQSLNDRKEMKRAQRSQKLRLPACDKVNGKLECGGENPKERALKAPQPIEETLSK